MYQELESFFRGSTFPDFLLRPRKGIVLSRGLIDLTMPLTRNIILKGIPVIPANMRTVTDSNMAVAASLNGSIAFLPRGGNSIDEVVRQIEKVKRQQAFIIEDPLVLHRKATLKEARELIKRKKISGILVEEDAGSRILAGILSRRDIFGEDNDLIEKYMTKCPSDVVFGRGDITMEEAERIMNLIRKEKLPLLDGNRKIIGLITMKDLELAKQKPYATKDSKGRLIVGATIGAKEDSDYMERAEAVISAGVDVIIMDIAHGHSIVIEKAVRNFKNKFSDAELIVGNVATREGARFLIELGADAIKIGIGPGAGCRTRLETGFGVSQLQAIREGWLASRFDTGLNIPIIADGGIRHYGDISKAIACGASAVMMGALFAGTDEAPGRKYWDPKERRYMKKYGGETSPEMKLEQFSSNNEENNEEPGNLEGQMEPVPYVGPVSNVFRSLRQSLQSAVSYGGVEKLSDFHKEITLDVEKYIIKLSEASREESFNR